MEKRRRLNVELIKFLIGSMVIVGAFLLVGSFFVNNSQYTKFYNDKALEIAKTVSDQIDGDFIEKLSREIDSKEYVKTANEAVETENEQLIVDWLVEKGMYEEYEKINQLLHTVRSDMNIEYLYIQVIGDNSSMYLFEPESGYLSLGYEELLTEEFAKLQGNERLEPTVSRTGLGWLSSAGEPVVASSGENCAVVFVDIDMTAIVSNTIRFTVLMTGLCIMIILFAGIIVSKRIKKRISGPIELLTEATRSFGNGDDGYDENNIVKLDIHTRDEIEELYNATRFMQKSIIDYMNNLSHVTAEKERIGAELNVATNIQLSMLPCTFPAFPERTEFDIYAKLIMAKEMGGSFYDFFLVDQTHLAVIAGEIQGRGVPAALLMMITKTLIKNYAQLGYSPAQVFTEVNNQLSDTNEGMTITAFLGILDLGSGEFNYVNAGHSNPLLKHAGDNFEWLPAKDCFVLGVMEGVPYWQQSVKLLQGDLLFLYTKGLVEAENHEQVQYSAEHMQMRLDQVVKEAYELKKIAEIMEEDVKSFQEGAAREQDITMLLLRFF